MRFSVGEIARIVDGVPRGSLEATPVRAIHDSRLVRPGDLFVALRGARVDGHQYVQEAFSRGAVAVLAADPARLPEAAPAAIVVASPLAALQRLAVVWRERLSGRIVGITGSHGKTTTRALLAQILRARFAVHETPENFNSDIGLPLALLGMKEDDDLGVFELGTERPGDIALLAGILHPAIGLITGIGPSHLAHFGDLDSIADEKWSLIESLSGDGLGIINGDDPLLRARSGASRGQLLSVSTAGHSGASLQAIGIRAEPFLELDTVQPPMRLRTPLLGAHNASNVLLAACCALQLGILPQDIEEVAPSFRPAAHRLVRHARPWGTVIDDTYNANPVTTRAALRVLASCGNAGSRRLFVFGEMRDLGDDSERLHRETAAAALELGVDAIAPVGSLPAAACEGLPAAKIICASREDLRDAVRSFLRGSQDVVLVKGSRALRMDVLVEDLIGAREV